MGMFGEFICELVTGATGSCSGRVSTLSHEASNDPVECSVVVESFTGEKHKVVNRYRNIAGK